jgi:hypothetical protein
MVRIYPESKFCDFQYRERLIWGQSDIVAIISSPSAPALQAGKWLRGALAGHMASNAAKRFEPCRSEARRFTLAGLISVVPCAASAFLKLRGHRPVGIALSVPNIDVSTVPAWYGVRPTTMVASAAVIPAPIGIHLLRGQVSVRIAHPITGAEVPAMTAGRPTNGHAVLNFVDRGRCFVRRVTRRCHLKRNRYAGYVQKHLYVPR